MVNLCFYGFPLNITNRRKDISSSSSLFYLCVNKVCVLNTTRKRHKQTVRYLLFSLHKKMCSTLSAIAPHICVLFAHVFIVSGKHWDQHLSFRMRSPIISINDPQNSNKDDFWRNASYAVIKKRFRVVFLKTAAVWVCGTRFVEWWLCTMKFYTSFRSHSVCKVVLSIYFLKDMNGKWKILLCRMYRGKLCLLY